MKAIPVSVMLALFMSIVVLSGCTNQTPQNGVNGITHDEFLVNNSGGDFEAHDGSVYFTFHQEAVDQQTTITIDSVDDPPYDTNLVLTNCYSFGPDGVSFNKPVDLTLKYDDDQIPSTVLPENLSLFVLSYTTWSPIDNCMVDTLRHTVTGQISHFCLVGVGFIPFGELEHSSEHNDSENTSAIITFDVPIQLHEHETTFDTVNGPDDTIYSCCAYIAWDPSPYVRYYEVTVHFNGNTLHDQDIFASCDYRNWGKKYCPLGPHGYAEGTTVFLGPGTINYPNNGDYVGTYDNSRDITGNDKHGLIVKSMQTEIYGYEKWTREQIDTIEREMYSFLEDYVQGWTYTIKNVS